MDGEKHLKTCRQRDKYEIQNEFFLVFEIRDSDWVFTLFPELLVGWVNNRGTDNWFNWWCRSYGSERVSRQSSKEGGRNMKTGKTGRRLVLMGFFLSFTLIFTGCAHTVLVAPKPPEKGNIEKIPIDVGLYITDEFKNYKVSEYRKGDKWNYTNLGEGSSAQFRLGFSQIFRKVEIVDGKPPFSKPKATTLQAVIEPIIYKFMFDIPITKFQVYPAMIGYKITMYDMNGSILFTKMVDGIGDTKGQPGFNFAANPSKSATKAVEDGINKTLDVILASEEIKTLLKEATK